MPSVPLCFAISLLSPKMRHLLNLFIPVCFPQICFVSVGIVNSVDPRYSSSSFYWLDRSQKCYSVPFSLVAQSCLILCNPMDCSMPGFPVSPSPRPCWNSCPSSWQCHPTISSSVVPFSSCLQSFPASGSFSQHQVLKSCWYQLNLNMTDDHYCSTGNLRRQTHQRFQLFRQRKTDIIWYHLYVES